MTNLTSPGILPSGLNQPTTLSPSSFTTLLLDNTSMSTSPAALDVSPVKPVLPVSPGTAGLINPVLPLKSGSPRLMNPVSHSLLPLTSGLTTPVSPLTGLGNPVNPAFSQPPPIGLQRPLLLPPPPPPPPPPLPAYMSPHHQMLPFPPPMQPVQPVQPVVANPYPSATHFVQQVQPAVPVFQVQAPPYVPPPQVQMVTPQLQPTVVHAVPVAQAQYIQQPTPPQQIMMTVPAAPPPPPHPPPPPIIHMHPPMGPTVYTLYR